MNKKSLDEILSDFNPKSTLQKSNLKSGGPVTIWLPKEYKSRYDELQKTSDRRFCKKIRELIQAAIDMTEAKAS